jgi:hypothetical protein
MAVEQAPSVADTRAGSRTTAVAALWAGLTLKQDLLRAHEQRAEGHIGVTCKRDVACGKKVTLFTREHKYGQQAAQGSGSLWGLSQHPASVTQRADSFTASKSHWLSPSRAAVPTRDPAAVGGTPVHVIQLVVKHVLHKWEPAARGPHEQTTGSRVLFRLPRQAGNMHIRASHGRWRRRRTCSLQWCAAHPWACRWSLRCRAAEWGASADGVNEQHLSAQLTQPHN